MQHQHYYEQQQQSQNPYAKSLAYKNVPDTFKTTYGTSYLKIHTHEASPVYRKEEKLLDPNRWFPHDKSPYPAAHDDVPIQLKRPYQPMSFYEEEVLTRQLKDDFRNRFDDYTLRRDEYSEPPPQYRHNQEEIGVQERPQESHREHDGFREQAQRRFDDKAEYLRAQYDDLVAEGQSTDPNDLRPAFCHNPNCFEDKSCMNQLGCGHQFCDACMSKMPGSDGPFRDSIRWHYCCQICRKWTSEPKLVRKDPFGRRLGQRPSSR